MKLTKWMAATALFLSFGVAGCTDDITDEVSQLTRNTDEVSVAYNKDATARISVRVPGAWSASVACKDATGQETAAWLRLDPAEGVGNGKDYQWITAIADRNLGGEREAVITIVGATRGDAVEVKVTQDDGTFTVKKPVLSGDLKANVASNALLAVEYDKAKGGEPVEMTFTFDGDNRGLAIKDYTGTIEGEGSGKIELPITGTPSDIGVVKLNMKMTIEGKTIFDDVISLNIQSENFIFSMDFGKFVWGGDLMANKKGRFPVRILRASKRPTARSRWEPTARATPSSRWVRPTASTAIWSVGRESVSTNTRVTSSSERAATTVGFRRRKWTNSLRRRRPSSCRSTSRCTINPMI